MFSNWDRVVALDDYTVAFQFTEPAMGLGLGMVMDNSPMNLIEAPEWVEQGDLQNWDNAVGTGAWMLEDYDPNVQMTYTRNPDYWGYDERYPQNQLPYADTLKILWITDQSTQLAALRTGKLDIMTNLTWQKVQGLTKTNPELTQRKIPSAGTAIAFRLDKAPFTDVRVRKALEMSIDREAISNLYHADTDGSFTPCGFVNPSMTNFCYDYNEWPQDLKDTFSYNPTQAKELLAEAGYSQLETNVVTDSTADMEALQLFKAYFNDIGVDMEIKVMDVAVARSYLISGKHDQMFSTVSGMSMSPNSLLYFVDPASTSLNFYCNQDDTVIAALCAKIGTAASPDEVAQVVHDVDKYVIENYYSVWGAPAYSYYYWQPYLKGYSGEYLDAIFGTDYYFARLWIDQD